jgi:hypothetical protein
MTALACPGIKCIYTPTSARCVQVSSYWAYYPQVRTEMNEGHPRRDGPAWVCYRREAEDILSEAGAAILHLPDFYGRRCMSAHCRMRFESEKPRISANQYLSVSRRSMPIRYAVNFGYAEELMQSAPDVFLLQLTTGLTLFNEAAIRRL